MATLIHLLSFVFSITAFLFISLSLASGLLWLADLIEEHSKVAKTIGMRLIYVVIALHVLLFAFDRLPIYRLLFSVTCHLVYLTNFTAAWPFISLLSPRFLASCCLVITDHFVWFFYFAEKSQEGKRYRPGAKYRSGAGARQSQPAPPAFMDVVAFFAFCVWLVPLFLFLSLSANDNVLPSTGPGTPSQRVMEDPFKESSPSRTRTRTSLLKTALAPLLDLLPRSGSRRSRAETGIIAPPTPLRGSTPLPSPGLVSAAPYSPWGESPSTFGIPGGATRQDRAFGEASAARRIVQMAPPPPRRSVSEYHVSSNSRLAPSGDIPAGGNGHVEEFGLVGEPDSLSSGAASSTLLPSKSASGLSARKAVSSSMVNGRNKDD